MHIRSPSTVRRVRADRWVTRLAWLMALAAITGSLGSPTKSAHAQAVVPIDWNRFSPASTLDPFAQDVKAFLNNSARYNVNWVAQRYPSVTSTETTTGRRYDMQSSSEGEIRSIGHAAYGVAAMLKTGAVDPAVTGVSAATLVDRTMEMIHGAALEHRANGTGVQWGNTWQSALWAADVAESAWMMWDQLPAATRSHVTNMTIYEANRFVNYDVPYWSNPDGTRNYPGDTKAEENAWNSRILAVAVGMMPEHPNSAAWRNKASELLVSSFSRPSDLQNAAVLDGKPVAAWLDGYNAYQSGFVDNHGLLHNDYLGTTDFTIYPYITQSLAGQAVPQTAGFNFPIVYNAMATTPVGAQNRPMFQRMADGGYLADQHYPDGTDWSVHRHDIFLQLDAFAEKFGVDTGTAYDAVGWGRARLDRMLQMQSRHADGRLYAPGVRLLASEGSLRVRSNVTRVDNELARQAGRVKCAIQLDRKPSAAGAGVFEAASQSHHRRDDAPQCRRRNLRRPRGVRRSLHRRSPRPECLDDSFSAGCGRLDRGQSIGQSTRRIELREPIARRPWDKH
jgi:hypothetical protein